MRKKEMAMRSLLVCMLFGYSIFPLDTIISNGGFERSVILASHDSAAGVWSAFTVPGHTNVFALSKDGRSGGSCAVYEKTAGGSHNLHLDQVISVTPHRWYDVRLWMRGDTNVRPVIAIAAMDWKMIAMETTPLTEEWRELRFIFNAFTNTIVRFEWFAGAAGKPFSGIAGRSWLDDVSITPLHDVPPALDRGNDVASPKLPTRIPTAVSAVPDVPASIRRIVARDGVLHYENGGEVALWGISLQASISWEYNGRLKRAGVPLTAEALHDVVDRTFAHMPMLGADIIRVHLLPSDFSDAAGNIVDTVYLDALDHLIAQCHARKKYIYLTLLNGMGTLYCSNSFMAKYPKTCSAGWIFDPDFTAASAQYFRSFLLRTNRYAKIAYKDDPAIAVIELINEPLYPSLLDIDNNEYAVRRQFEDWRKRNGLPTHADAYSFRLWRYEEVLAYIKNMHAVIRGTGSRHPIAWNLNWPKMITDHEDVFQAVADSPVDAVSFCLYPGQPDCRQPYWSYPTNLAGINYLPRLSEHYTRYDHLRWIVAERFSKKAKLVYEFETHYNHETSYIYPAMAALFRALGVQTAQMLNYTLPPLTEYAGGSHYLSLYGSPQKSMGFRIAGEVFRSTPRYTPFETDPKTEIIRSNWAASFSRNCAVYAAAGTVIHAGSVGEWPPFIDWEKVSEVIGIGDSPLFLYRGTGAYAAKIDALGIDLTLLPNCDMHAPLWSRPEWNNGGPYPKKMCTLVEPSPSAFTMKSDVPVDTIRKLNDETNRTGMRTGAFSGEPGRYRITFRK